MKWVGLGIFWHNIEINMEESTDSRRQCVHARNVTMKPQWMEFEEKTSVHLVCIPFLCQDDLEHFAKEVIICTPPFSFQNVDFYSTNFRQFKEQSQFVEDYSRLRLELHRGILLNLLLSVWRSRHCWIKLRIMQWSCPWKDKKIKALLWQRNIKGRRFKRSNHVRRAREHEQEGCWELSIQEQGEGRPSRRGGCRGWVTPEEQGISFLPTAVT